MAVGALILSISATTLGGSANAAPSADETTSCSALAHARNDAVHTLHAAFKDFREQLKDLAHDARELERDARHSKSATEMTVDARHEVADARAKLQEIWTTAHAKLQSLVELGQACKDEDKDEEKDKDEDSTKSSTTTAVTTNGPSLAALVAKSKDIVDQAIKDMQAVLDDVTATVAKMTTAAQSTDASMAAKVKAERAKEKDARNHEHGRSTNRGDGKGSRG
ncbi:MAG TPA: hypothetical protein VGR46_14835 [Candidatus Limnocylindria bacterium]|jgi:DNA repair exonuclease SbcCD ATPase subunit|nr:hypothetical protein [Candidatus Limnocylindria bacterium]